MKRPLAIIAFIYTGGVLLGNFAPIDLRYLYVLSFLFAWLALFRSTGRPILLWPLLLFAGWTNMVTRTVVISPNDLRNQMGERDVLVTLRATLDETPTQRVYDRQGSESWRSLVPVEATALKESGEWHPAFGRVMVSTPGILQSSLFAGQTVEVAGVLRRPKVALAEGLFDYRAYLRVQRIHYQLAVDSTNDWRVVGGNGPPPKQPWGDRFCRWAQATMAAGLPAQDESLRLLWAMAVGWQTGLTNEVSEPFMRTGTMHIFAISGLHIALIAGILVSLLRVLQIRRSACGLLVLPLIWFYTAATGWQSSAVRSTIMMSIIIAGWALKRPTNLINSLSAAALIILLWQPEQLFQASFQLSFFVVLSIALLMPPFEALRQHLLRDDPLVPTDLQPRWRRWCEPPIRFLTGSLAVSLAAFLGSLPLVAFYFHLVTPISLAANLVIVPMSSLALMCNLGSLLCGDWLPWLTELLNYSGWFWMTGMIRLCQWAANLPGAYFYVRPPTLLGFTAYYCLLFVTLTGVLSTARRRYWTAAVFASLAVFWLMQGYAEATTVRLTFLPLDRGSAVFCQGPRRANEVLINCGNESAADRIVKPYLHGQGVNRLPQLWLTHGGVHYVGGIGLIEHEFRANQIVTSSARFQSPSYRAILEGLARNRARWKQINRGDQLGIWTALHPSSTDRFSAGDDSAMVLRAQIMGTRLLLIPSLGRSGQKQLLEREANLKADILVAGLPVRDPPLMEALVAAVQPRVILLTPGPTPVSHRVEVALRRRLEGHGAAVVETTASGAVTLVLGPQRWELCTINGPFITSSAAPQPL